MPSSLPLSRDTATFCPSLSSSIVVTGRYSKPSFVFVWSIVVLIRFLKVGDLDNGGALGKNLGDEHFRLPVGVTGNGGVLGKNLGDGHFRLPVGVMGNGGVLQKSLGDGHFRLPVGVTAPFVLFLFCCSCLGYR